jgi:hypothetical protein
MARRAVSLARLRVAYSFAIHGTATAFAKAASKLSAASSKLFLLLM